MFLADLVQLLAEHQRFRCRLCRCGAGAAASDAFCFSSSLDGGELFSRIQDRGDQAFTERGMEPTGTWSFVFGPCLDAYRSVSGPAPSLNRCFESPARLCTWGMRNVGASGSALRAHLRAGLGDVFSAAPEPPPSHSSTCRGFSDLQEHLPPSKDEVQGLWFS